MASADGDATSSLTTTTTTTTTTIQSFYDQSFASVRFSLLLNLIMLIALLGILEALFRWPGTRRFVAPRLNVALPSGLLGWARLASRCWGSPMNLDPDAEVFVRFLGLGFKFSFMGSLLDIVLLPLYYTGNGDAEEFNRFSISNLQMRGSGRFWAVIASAYVLTAGFAYLLLCEWSSFLSMRSAHLTRMSGGRSLGGTQSAQACRSVMVELVPPDFREESLVRAFFESLFGQGSVHSCTLAKADPRTILARALPRELATRELRPAGEPMLPQANLSSAPSVVDGLHQQALGAVQLLQDATIGRGVSSTGFVTFKSVALAVQAQQVRLSETRAWRVREAPGPGDLIWQNVPKPLPQVVLRHSLAQIACTLGLIFWSLPVTLIQGWAQIGNLQNKFPFVSDVQNKLPWAYSFLTDYLPVLALIGLQCLLPSVFECMAVRYEGHKTKSEVQRIVLNRCGSYQLASLWVTMITGSIWIELQNILRAPASLLDLLSSSLPKVAVYFVTFVFTRTGFSLPLLLLRPWDLLPGPPASAVRCAFGCEAANAALVLVIGLTYSFIAPAILPACALYFGFATIVYRWLFGYVYEPEFDGRGAFWYDLFNSALLGLLIGTLALVALACLRATALQVACLVPLPVGVAWFGHWCWKHLGHPSKLVALADAVVADGEEGGPDPVEGLYASPVPQRSRHSMEQQQGLASAQVTPLG